jgi:hypothetical protein
VPCQQQRRRKREEWEMKAKENDGTVEDERRRKVKNRGDKCIG